MFPDDEGDCFAGLQFCAHVHLRNGRYQAITSMLPRLREEMRKDVSSLVLIEWIMTEQVTLAPGQTHRNAVQESSRDPRRQFRPL